MELFNADEKRLWREYCAIVQLPMNQFLDIQNALLSEQLDLVAKNRWYDPFVGGGLPKNIEEFRRTVPLHVWKDYEPHLQSESLNGYAGDPHCWVHTSWTHGSFKKVPWARRFYDAQCRHAIAAMMMSVARYEGDVRLNKNFRVLPILPDAPFASAWLESGILQREIVTSNLDTQKDDSDLTMSQRIQAGIWRSMEPGVDCIIGMASTLLLARREFERMVAKTSFRQLRSQVGSRAAFKWALGIIRRTITGQPWEPKSLLAPKSIITWGADTSILTPTLEAQWGAPVFQLYASSEGGIMAMQDWRRKGLVPLPTSVFMEFLPAGASPDNEATVLIDELQVGQLYEPILTSFYGMPFLRLRQGDLLRVEGHSEHGVPVFEFHSRADDIIDLGSIARIDTETLTEALNQVGINKEEWVARKELTDGRPTMCLYIDREPEQVKEMRHKVHRALGKVDPHYREASYTLGYPLMRLISTREGAEGLPKGSDSKQVAEAVALD